MATFMEMLQAKWDEGKFVCVGLDSDLDSPKFPARVPFHDWAYMHEELNQQQMRQLAFNCHIIDATKNLACAYKPNLAFYRGESGKHVLRLTIQYIRGDVSDALAILDAKQADIGNTNDGYVEEDFDYYEASAVTVHPFLGMEAMRPFLNRADKGIIILCRTSNPGAGELQDLIVDGEPLYQRIARNVTGGWNYNGNCAVVVGATYPDELARVREIIGDMPILIPGVGAQGGDLEKTVLAGRNSRNQGMIINSSRGIIFASSGEDFAEAARTETQKLHDAIHAVLTAA